MPDLLLNQLKLIKLAPDDFQNILELKVQGGRHPTLFCSTS